MVTEEGSGFTLAGEVVTAGFVVADEIATGGCAVATDADEIVTEDINDDLTQADVVVVTGGCLEVAHADEVVVVFDLIIDG